jgi:hypothetical protein
MKTWADVRHFIVKNELPYTIIRFNMSLEGRLIETATGETVASTIKEAAAYFNGGNRETSEKNVALVPVGSDKADDRGRESGVSGI